MDKFDVLANFVGSLEPSTWVTGRGLSAWLLVALLFCAFVLFRDGIRGGVFSLMRYVMSLATLAAVVFSIY